MEMKLIPVAKLRMSRNPEVKTSLSKAGVDLRMVVNVVCSAVLLFACNKGLSNPFKVRNPQIKKKLRRMNKKSGTKMIGLLVINFQLCLRESA